MIAWLFKSGLLLAIFYLFYLLFMRKTTFFVFNRIMLSLGGSICFLLPLFDFSTIVPVEVMPTIQLPTLVVNGQGAGVEVSTLNWNSILLTIYLVGAAIVLIFTLISIFRTISIIKKGERVNLKECKLTIIDEKIPSFTFFRNIVISREDYENNPVILSHELQHVKFMHSISVLSYAVVTIIQWFNPLVWILRTELKMLHEYEADEAVIKQGIDATQYQLLLVKKAVGAHLFQMANGFNHAKLKNRITMMQSTKSNKFKRLLYLACLPLMAFGLSFCNQQKEETTDPGVEIEFSDQTKAPATVEIQVEDATKEEDTFPFAEVTDKPTFNGGDAGDFAKWVNTRLVYPEDAKKEEKQGRVLLQFTVNKEGKVVNVKVIRGVSPSLDAAAVRAVESSPRWTPGKINGKQVNVTYIFPVLFQLR